MGSHADRKTNKMVLLSSHMAQWPWPWRQKDKHMLRIHLDSSRYSSLLPPGHMECKVVSFVPSGWLVSKLEGCVGELTLVFVVGRLDSQQWSQLGQPQ